MINVSQRPNYIHRMILPVVVCLLLSVAGYCTTRKVAADPLVFAINSTADSADLQPGDGQCKTTAGTCTLRAAIQESNANGNPETSDTISFNLLEKGVQTIEVATPLPAISQPLSIDGYTKSDSLPGTTESPEPLNTKITVQIDGQAVKDKPGFIIQSSGVTLRGMAVYGFGDDKLSCQVEFWSGASESSITGSYIGVLADGLTKKSTRSGPAVCTSKGSKNITVGGEHAESRNVIAHSKGLASVVISGGETRVLGNYIGIAANGSRVFGGLGGVAIEGSQNTVGAEGGGRNVISGNSVYQVVLTGDANKVQTNYIGTNAQGGFDSKISNGSGVTMINGASGNLIGGTGGQSGNVIRGVQGTGVVVAENYSTASKKTQTPTKNSILGNIITDVSTAKFLGIGELNMGIDLVRYEYTSDAQDALPESATNAGPTINDDKDRDEGPNGFINAPVLRSAEQTVNGLSVVLDLDAQDSPIDQYRIEFFSTKSSHVSKHGLAENYLGSAIVGPGTGQQINLRIQDISSKQLAGSQVTATTTAIDTTVSPTGGFGSTSEFAQNISITKESSDTQRRGIILPGWAIGLIVVGGVGLLWMFISSYGDYIKHKRPLTEIDPLVHYSYFHHLYIVSVPRLRYRLRMRLPGKRRKLPQLPPDLSE